MISVSVLRASEGLLEGLRFPSSKFRPSPKPIATDGTPIARMREQTIAARPEKRSFFMHLATPAPQESCGAARCLSVHSRCAGKPRNLWLAFAGLLGGVHRHRDAEIQRGADDPGLLDGVGGRIALARRGALRPAGVAELDVGRQDLQQAR